MNLDRTICPGCGKENPASAATDYFQCAKCEYECDHFLPTVADFLNNTKRSRGSWNHVRLDLFLRTLWNP